jgi:hypothetical protein
MGKIIEALQKGKDPTTYTPDEDDDGEGPGSPGSPGGSPPGFGPSPGSGSGGFQSAGVRPDFNESSTGEIIGFKILGGEKQTESQKQEPQKETPRKEEPSKEESMFQRNDARLAEIKRIQAENAKARQAMDEKLRKKNAEIDDYVRRVSLEPVVQKAKDMMWEPPEVREARGKDVLKHPREVKDTSYTDGRTNIKEQIKKSRGEDQ